MDSVLELQLYNLHGVCCLWGTIFQRFQENVWYADLSCDQKVYALELGR